MAKRQAKAKAKTNSATEDIGTAASPAISGAAKSDGQSIAELAYLKSERRGFEPGYEMQDWLEAEREINEHAL